MTQILNLSAPITRRLFLASATAGALASTGFGADKKRPRVLTFPPVSELPENAMMPDPFKKPDGTRVASLAEWPEQRAYLRAILEHYLYGTIPPRPTGKELSFERTTDEAYTPPDSKLEGRKQSYRITISRNSLKHFFTFSLWRRAEKKRYPTLINNYPEHSNGAKEFSMAEGLRRGYMVVEFLRGEVAPDNPGNANRQQGIFPLYRDYDFYTIGAWAWAYQPVMDVLDQLGVADMKKIISTGHSRGGFTAMAAAIFDERIAIAAPSAAGPFSTGSVRQRDPAGFRGTADYPDIMIRNFLHWFHPRYLEFTKRQNKLPWDVPTLTALIAPRPLLSLNSVGDGFDNWLAHEVGIRSGLAIHNWFSAGQWCRIHWRDTTNKFGQKGHDQGPEEFLAIFDYADEFFFGKSPGPTVFNRMPGFDTWRYDPVKHPLLMNWKVPQTR